MSADLYWHPHYLAVHWDQYSKNRTKIDHFPHKRLVSVVRRKILDHAKSFNICRDTERERESRQIELYM